MKILVSNDDGYRARGLRALAAALGEIAEVTVVAPDRNRSGASNSLTLESPLRVRHESERLLSVNGTPTDCVHLALTGLLEEEPDMVVSGINHGPNLGDDVLYSGTVAAAMEGRFLGLPALALSMAGEPARHFETGARVATELVQRLGNSALPADTILNVNIPDLAYGDLRGFRATRLGHRHRAEAAFEARDPRNRKIYWIGPAGPEQDAGPGTDFEAVNSGYVSVTPLQVDLTRYVALDEVANWLGAAQ